MRMCPDHGIPEFSDLGCRRALAGHLAPCGRWCPWIYWIDVDRPPGFGSLVRQHQHGSMYRPRRGLRAWPDWYGLVLTRPCRTGTTWPCYPGTPVLHHPGYTPPADARTRTSAVVCGSVPRLKVCYGSFKALRNSQNHLYKLLG